MSTEGLRRCLAEAIQHVTAHGREYHHVTPPAQIAEWSRVLVRVPRDTLPTPGPCPACKVAPMALGGRILLQSAEELRALDDHEASG